MTQGVVVYLNMVITSVTPRTVVELLFKNRPAILQKQARVQGYAACTLVL